MEKLNCVPDKDLQKGTAIIVLEEIYSRAETEELRNAISTVQQELIQDRYQGCRDYEGEGIVDVENHILNHDEEAGYTSEEDLKTADEIAMERLDEVAKISKSPEMQVAIDIVQEFLEGGPLFAPSVKYKEVEV